MRRAGRQGDDGRACARSGRCLGLGLGWDAEGGADESAIVQPNGRDRASLRPARASSNSDDNRRIGCAL
jgi:hypothetical protein